MDYSDTPFVLKDKRNKWTTKQVMKVLGSNLIEKDAYGIKTTCVLGIRHESAKVTMEYSKYVYECRQCLYENGIDYENQKQQFQSWLADDAGNRADFRGDPVTGTWRTTVLNESGNRVDLTGLTLGPVGVTNSDH